MARPRGGDWLEDEIASLVRSGVATIVSLLEPAEEHDLDLVDERRQAEANGIEYVSLPMPDRGVPADGRAAIAVVEEMARAVARGRRVVVHCRQGIGRAALVACATLNRLGYSADDAMAAAGEARGCKVPETEEQVRWLRERAITVRLGSDSPSSSE